MPAEPTPYCHLHHRLRPSASTAAAAAVLLLIALLSGGCQDKPRIAQPISHAELATMSWAGLSPPYPLASVRALCAPPVGWRAEPLKHSKRHNHQVWLSPSGKTAYGVIYVRLPLPVGQNLALWGFLREMRRVEGEAILRSRRHDPDLPGLRFVAEGGPYKLRANLLIDGMEGWVVYAGTLRREPLVREELSQAARARDLTQPGLLSLADVAADRLKWTD